MSTRKIVYLVANIPTHVRVLMGVAQLLHDSGEYDPCMVYYPAAVFDLNQERCAEAPWRSLLWRGTHFEEGVRRIPDAPIAAAPHTPVTEEAPRASFIVRSMPRWLYGVLKPALGPAFRKAYPWLHGVFYGVYGWIKRHILPRIGMMCALGRETGSDALGFTAQGARNKLLSAFGRAWNASASRVAGEGILAFSWRRVLEEGLFPGVGAQKHFYAGISDLFSRDSVALVVLSEDNLFYFNHLWIHAAHAAGTPVAVVPFTIANSLEWAEAFYNNPDFQAGTKGNRLIAKGFAHWVLEHRGHRLMLPRTLVVGSEYLGVAPGRPWVINSGKADILCCESRFMADYYARAGIAADSIVMTGAVSDDKLFRALQTREVGRSALSARTGHDLQGKVVLIALPPNQFDGIPRQGCEFSRYDELIRFMVEQCRQVLDSQGALLINLHPRIHPEQVAFLGDMPGVTVVDAPIEELVPLADLYVAVASATIRLAISCAVPVINYDAFQYHYDDYTSFDAVVHAQTKSDYVDALRRYLADPAAYEAARRTQQQVAKALCDVDGFSAQRMLNALQSLKVRREQGSDKAT